MNMIRDIHGCALTTILADFYTTAHGAYPDLHVTIGGSCILLEWGSHALSAWLDVMNGCGDITITHDDSEQDKTGGPDPLATTVDLIVEHITETGYDPDRGEDPAGATPGTFAARVWVKFYRDRVRRLDPRGEHAAEHPVAGYLAHIARLDPEGTYSAKQPDALPIAKHDDVDAADF